MEVGGWLRSLGLAQYEARFREHEIDANVLTELAEGDLQSLGIPLGHRKRLLKAIRALQEEASQSTPAPLDAPHLAERRQVTVMFCDLVGSTELASRLDPEDVREVITRYQARVSQTVSQFGGFVARHMGDGVLAYFGYPQAHEDDPEQAVRAGLTLISAVGDLARDDQRRNPRRSESLAQTMGESGMGERQRIYPALEAQQRLQVRIGIATGMVVVGDLIGSGSAQEQAVFGETPNLAARLQALAEPDSVVIADGTRRQIGARFEVADLGTQSLKSFAEPQRVWRVLAENRVLGRFEALRSGTTPLVGREEEMELLLRVWAQATGGNGRVVLISGEPGLGKSRLAQVLGERIAGERPIQLHYFCSPHHQESALYPIIAQQERAARFAHEDGVREKLAKLQGVLAATTLTMDDVALIAELHAVQNVELKPPLDMTPQRKKEKTFEALLRQVEGLSRKHAVLMVFEDIQWIDPSSRELLDCAIERVAKWPILLVATFRPEFQPPWVGQPHVVMLNLARLDRHDTAAMVANIASGAVLSTEIVQEITDRTDGVPLFIEELTNAVLESGAQPALSSLPHPALAVPATLQASLMARLDRLVPTAKNLAQTGAAIGREFGHELLASVCDLPEPQLQEALGRLTQSGLVFARGRPPQSTYIFKHALVRDAAYGTLLRSVRQRLHARIVAALEDRFPEIVTAQPALLAQHCTEAGIAKEAVVYWLQAGRQALARSATTEAVVQLRKGLDMLAGLPDDFWRRQQELELQIALRPALAAAKGFSSAEVGETITRARALAAQIDRPEYLVRLTAGQWEFHCARSEHRLALQLAQQIEKIGETRKDATTRLVGRSLHGLSRLFLGELIAARTLLEDYLAHPTGRASATLPLDPHTTMTAYHAASLTYLGYIDQARLRLNEGLSEARRLRRAPTLAHVLCWVSRLDGLTRSPELEEHAEELLALSSEHGFSLYAGWALALRGRLLTTLGRAEEGLALLRQGMAAARATGAVVGTPTLLMLLAEAYAELGRPVEGLRCIAEASQIIETTKERHEEAELHRVRGLLNTVGNGAAAEQDYCQALAIAERQSAKLLELRSATSLARLLRDRGKIADARDLLTPIYAWFTEGFNASDLIEAKALLGELAAN